MSSSSLNFMLGIFVIFFVIIGFSSAEKTTLAECGEGCARGTTADGKEYGYMVYDELIVFTNSENKYGLFHCHGYGQNCDFLDEDPSGDYRNDIRTALHDVDFVGKVDNINQKNDWIVKYEVAVMEPKYISQFIFPYDVTTFGFPAFSFYLNNQQSIKVLISAGNLNTHDRNGKGPYVLFFDPEDKCRQYRPTSATLTNFMNMNWYINVKYGKNAYYFIKKDNFICGYAFKHEDLYQFINAYQKAPEIKHVNNYLIDTYPTDNYAPNFFCIDALYGAFVSLYWDHEPSHPPEAHFYQINEINLNNIKMVHKVILKNFDDNVLRMIFANDFDARFQPVFQSYGGLVHVWFKLPTYQPTIQLWKYENKAWHGLWKNENDFDVQYQHLMAFSATTMNNELVNPNRILFRAKKSWITKDRPIKAVSSPQSPTEQEQSQQDQQYPPFPKTEAPKTDPPPTDPPQTPLPTTEAPIPPTTTEPVTVPPFPATSAPKTTTLPPQMPSTTLPPTNPSRSSPQDPTTVPQPQNPMNTTSTSAPSNAPSGSTIPGSSNSSSETSSNDTNTIPLPPTPEQLKSTSNGNDDGNCSFSKNLPWIFILLIILDVVEVIILGVLVFLKFRGAKKMREAMAKKKALKSVKNDKKKKKPSTESKQSMPMKKPMSEKKKKQKKSIKEKSTKEKSVTKTEEVGKTTASEAPKTTTVDQTNYYTINQSFKKKAK